MINTVYELITDVMAKQYPDRVAFRYVQLFIQWYRFVIFEFHE